MSNVQLKSVSQRSLNVEGSITMQISSLAQQMRRDGQNVIGFGAGEPDFDTPDFIKEAGIKAIRDGQTKYTPAAGTVDLKEAIVRKLQRDQNVSYAPDQIVVSCGAKHSVYNVLMALINPGDEVLIPAPYWVSYPQQARLLEGVPVVIDTNEASQFKITPEQLERAITPKTKVLILNSPSNPTGMVYTRSELEALAAVIVKHQIYVLSDEIYEHLIYDNTKHVSIAELGDEIKALTIVVNGVAKAYSMTGWRIGYTASSVEIAKAMGKMQSHMTSNPASMAQAAAQAALDGPQDVVEEMRLAFDERRQQMMRLLSEIEGVTCEMPQGAFYMFPNVSAVFAKSTPDKKLANCFDFCQTLLKEAMVACVPGIGFGAEGYLRLSYATSSEMIDEGLTRLKDWVHSL
ncbi:aspartate aminotransferase [Candidatus Marinamargulisbacteria bacterium SCGC AG-439-L15]|nr:aspartate aminotransferase [Candidatus Marinamargulisbacteria bacterium SCGC AG-439-L15]